MFWILYSSKIIIILLVIILLILNKISKKKIFDKEKNSPFECGFEPKNSARISFSMQFFLIAVIFIIFDVELTILLPMILTLKNSNIIYFSMTVTSFILVLLIGLYHEWKQSALEWEK